MDRTVGGDARRPDADAQHTSGDDVVVDATLRHGTVEHGAVEDGAVEHGAVEHGAVEHGAVEDGVVEDGELENGAVVALVRAAGGALVALPRWCGVLAAVAWMGLNWWLSSGSRGPQGDSRVFAFLANLAHAPLFGLLALWWVVALPRRERPFRWARLDVAGLFAVWIAVVLWGAVDEWHQSSVPGREPSTSDLVTDGVAAAAVLVVASHAGRPGATARGVLVRLALGATACVAAAAVATAT